MGRRVPASFGALRSWSRSVRPSFRTTPVQPGPPTVYLLAPDYDRPSGGVRIMYRHVDILNDAGVRARVLHHRRGFRCTWFANETAVTNSEQTGVGPDDTLVVGELDIDLVVEATRPVRHVVLNQSRHLTWQQRPELVCLPLTQCRPDYSV